MVQRHQNWGQTRRIVPAMPKRNQYILLFLNTIFYLQTWFLFSPFVRTTGLWKTCTSVQVLDGDKSACFAGVGQSSLFEGETHVLAA